ncbi:MAG: nucleotidyltransferase family protein, partial [Candidatus Krumholzibacteriia bacterium]
MHPELLVMAAGVGSRFGGLKQLEPVGPGGEKLLDYSIFDALRAGVERVVFVIRRDLEADFHALVGARFAGRVEVVYAHQELDDVPSWFAVPAGRAKPWGTAHAILAARDAMRAPFMVINADDFYGAAGYAQMARFLREPAATPPERWAMVAYRLANTLSAHGTVSRGVCTAGPDGLLRDIVERTALVPDDGGARETGPDGGDRRYPGDTPVSMNFWGFTPAIFPHLAARFERFLRARGGEPKAELYIPAVVKELMDE